MLPVVTGLGFITSIGNDRAAVLGSLRELRHGFERIEFFGPLAFGQRFIETALEAHGESELVVGESVIRIELDSPSEFLFRASPIVLIPAFVIGEGGVRFGGIGIERESFFRGRLCF